MSSSEECSTSTISWSRALSFSTGCDDLLDSTEGQVNNNNNNKEIVVDEQQSQEEVEFHYYGPATYTLSEYETNIMTASAVSSLTSNLSINTNEHQEEEEVTKEEKEVQPQQEVEEVGNKSLSAYSLKRKRNNLAVRKSREKAKRRFEELRKAEIRLEAQNEVLTRKIQEMEESLGKLRAYYDSIQIQMPQEQQQHQQQPINLMYAM